MHALLRTYSWQELRHHPWRYAAAVVAVMLGVALALSVHLINASALSEFSGAVRAVNGQPDLELRAAQGRLDETLYARVARHPQVTLASPVLDLATQAWPATESGETARRLPLRVLGVDALVVAAVAPALMPQPGPDADRLAVLAPATVFLNAAAAQALPPGTTRLRLQTGLALAEVRIAGRVLAGGAPLAVMDLGAAQDFFGAVGQLSRIDLRLAPGTDRAAFRASLPLPPGVLAGEADEASQRMSQLSRAYRVNLTALALVALFTGAFLVYSVLALSVARRAPQLALLGVLGLTPRQRLRLVLAEALALGLAGSAAGVALGTALAVLALRLLGGDLGGGYFAGAAPALQWQPGAAVLMAGLGVAAALAGAAWPARAAARLPPAQVLKGAGLPASGRRQRLLPFVALVAGVALAGLPPVHGLPLAAYGSVALLLVGGVTSLPALIGLIYDSLAPRVAHRWLPQLVVERARRVPGSAAVAIGGVVAALALAVALTVMVASFRDSVTRWLDVVLPADLYARSAASMSAADTVYFAPPQVAAVAQVAGVQRVGTQRIRALQLDASRPAVALIARDVGDPARSLALVSDPQPVPAGAVGLWVSEAMVDLYGARPGRPPTLLSDGIRQIVVSDRTSDATFFIAGVWRDYARQGGAVVIDRADYERLSGDRRVNDLALWLAPGADPAAVQAGVRNALDATLAPDGAAPGGGIEFATAAQVRATSLRIFDRSFAVTWWLQAVAIGIGLFGVAASFSAQVLARRKEFGLLAHLGFTRRQILAIVAGEGAAWSVAGAVAGAALGLAVAVVLVHVVNPQSFHWTMDLVVPSGRLSLLCAAVVAAGTLTAVLAGRAAASRDAVLAVKEDW